MCSSLLVVCKVCRSSHTPLPNRHHLGYYRSAQNNDSAPSAAIVHTASRVAQRLPCKAQSTWRSKGRPARTRRLAVQIVFGSITPLLLQKRNYIHPIGWVFEVADGRNSRDIRSSIQHDIADRLLAHSSKGYFAASAKRTFSISC